MARMMRAELDYKSSKNVTKIIDDYIKGVIGLERAVKLFMAETPFMEKEDAVSAVMRMASERRNEVTPQKPGTLDQTKKKPIYSKGYAKDAQKIISVMGTVRELDLRRRNIKGRNSLLKVFNVYIQPGNARYYEDGKIIVDKDKIRHGKHEDHYYPEKTKWKKAEPSERYPRGLHQSEIEASDINRKKRAPARARMLRKLRKNRRNKRRSR